MDKQEVIEKMSSVKTVSEWNDMRDVILKKSNLSKEEFIMAQSIIDQSDLIVKLNLRREN